MSDSKPAFDENPPPGKYGRMTLLPHAGPGALSTAEIARPLAEPARRVRSHFLATETISGKYTPEELTWPLVDTGSEIISPPRPAPATVAEPPIQPGLFEPSLPVHTTLPVAPTLVVRPSELARVDELLKRMEVLSGQLGAVVGSVSLIGIASGGVVGAMVWSVVGQLFLLSKQLRGAIGSDPAPQNSGDVQPKPNG